MSLWSCCSSDSVTLAIFLANCYAGSNVTKAGKQWWIHVFEHCFSLGSVLLKFLRTIVRVCLQFGSWLAEKLVLRDSLF